MKTLLTFCLMLFTASAFAANPTFQSFDTNDFTASAALNFITANTSPLNPNSLVNQSQLAGAVGPSNGITAGTATNISDYRFSQDIIPLSLAPSLVEQLNTTNHTLSQRFNIYDTFTDGSNYRRLSYYFSGADAFIEANAAGTGTGSGNMFIGTAGFHRLGFETRGTNRWSVQTDGTFQPAFDNIEDIGTPSAQVRALYVGTGITLASSSGLTVGSLQGIAHFGSGVMQGGVTAHLGFLQNDGTDGLLWTQNANALTNIDVTSLNTNGGTLGQVPVVQANGTVAWASPSGIPSGLGIVTNTAGGVVGVSVAVPGTWIAPGTLPNTAVDSSWPNKTNFWGYTNGAAGPAVAGMGVVIQGVDGNGVWKLAPTNYPTAGTGGNYSTNADGSAIFLFTLLMTNTATGIGSYQYAATTTAGEGMVFADGKTGIPGSSSILFSNAVSKGNFFTETNAFTGTTIDFAKAEGTTNLSGGLTISAVANVIAGYHNSTIRHLYPGGSDRVIAFPANFHLARGMTSVVSNAFNHSDFIFTVQPGFSTNVAQVDYQ